MGFEEEIFLYCFKIFSGLSRRFSCALLRIFCFFLQANFENGSFNQVGAIYIEDSLGSNGNILRCYIIAPR